MPNFTYRIEYRGHTKSIVIRKSNPKCPSKNGDVRSGLSEGRQSDSLYFATNTRDLMAWTPFTRRDHDRSRMHYASDLPDGEWSMIEPTCQGSHDEAVGAKPLCGR
jgi:hypothetical protein